MSTQFDSQKLKEWFLAEKRDLPWRQHPAPYAVWISEVMLQQTQVSVVLPYFKRWMNRFPTIESLAEAHLDDVIKAWEGLGYYSRARYLHEGAQYVVKHFSGKLPCQEEQLKKIKGLGPYTIGAILSFAFHQKKAAVDGNVLRVMARYFQLQDDIAKPATAKKIRALLEKLLQDEEPWIISEALIELGATICQRKARCLECPLKGGCQSFRHQTVGSFPVKSKGAATEHLYRAVAIIECQGNFLVRRGKKGQIMSDLYEFPYFDAPKEGLSLDQFKIVVEQHLGFNIQIDRPLESVGQGFTRYQVRLDPVLFTCSACLAVPDFEWMELERLQRRAFSSGHRRLFQVVQALING